MDDSTDQRLVTAEPLWARLRFRLTGLLGRGRLTQTAREARLERELEAVKLLLQAEKDEGDRLRLQVRTLQIDVDCSRHEVRRLAEVNERDRQRVLAETAEHVARQARAESGG